MRTFYETIKFLKYNSKNLWGGAMRYLISLISTATIFLSLLASIGFGATPQYPEMMFILDASGSMWGKAGAQTKIEAAKQVMARIVPALPQEVRVGLTAYGHNRKGDCNDIELLIPSGSDDRMALLQKVMALQPKGMTPIAASVQKVTDQLKNKESETTIVLVSDGEETCNDDPCAAVKALKASGIKFVLHVVGFDVNSKQKAQLACIAEAGGGQYFGAADSASLLAAFKTVEKEVVKKVAFEKAKTKTTKKSTGLGKIRVVLPEKGLISLRTLKIVRKKDNKVLRTIKGPKKDGTYPLPAGTYELIAGYANPNYKPDSEVSLETFEINGGVTKELKLGLLLVNIADSLKKMPTGAVIITKPDDPDFNLTLPAENGYYLYKPKPLVAGNYIFSVHYKASYLYRTPETPIALSATITIPESGEQVVTIDSGIKLKKAQDSSITGWELQTIGGEKTVMKIVQASNGSYPLWEPYAVRPGSYQLSVLLEGMDEPLLVTDEITISKGELLEFDTGL